MSAGFDGKNAQGRGHRVAQGPVHGQVGERVAQLPLEVGSAWVADIRADNDPPLPRPRLGDSRAQFEQDDRLDGHPRIAGGKPEQGQVPAMKVVILPCDLLSRA